MFCSTLHAYKAYTCPDSRQERSQSQQQRHQWLNGWRGLPCLKEDPRATPHCVWLTRWQFLRGEDREVTWGGLISGWLIGFQGNQQSDTLLTVPLDITALKLGQSLAGSWGKYVARSVRRAGRRWCRPWSNSGYREQPSRVAWPYSVFSSSVLLRV